MIRLFLFLVFIPSIAWSQIVSGPSTVGNGEAIHYQYHDFQAGDVINWTVLNPFPEPQVKEIRSVYGTSLVVDPPINWRGIVRVQCFVMDKEKRVKHFQTTQTVVEFGEPEPDDPPPDDDDDPQPPPDPPDDYTGPNKWGVGKVAFQKSPEYNAEVSRLFRQAAEHLYGREGSLKVVYTTNKELNATDYNVFNWIRNTMSRTHPQWDTWHNAVFEQMQDAGLKAGSPIGDWYDAFREAAAGVEARK